MLQDVTQKIKYPLAPSLVIKEYISKSISLTYEFKPSVDEVWKSAGSELAQKFISLRK